MKVTSTDMSMDRYQDGCKCEICVEDSVTETVQLYKVTSKFAITTLTCLDQLAIKEDCSCDIKSCVNHPRHLLFLLDGSDSFNRTYDDGKSSWFSNVKTFLKNFIMEAKFNARTAPVMISIYQFSGDNQNVKTYKAGSGGRVHPTDPKSTAVHWRCELDLECMNWKSPHAMEQIMGKIDSIQPLDGNGLMSLFLQDACLPSFLAKSDKAIGNAPEGIEPKDWQQERIMIILTDSQWDTTGVHNLEGKQVTENEIVKSTTNSYDRVYVASGDVSRITPGMMSSNYFANRLSTPGNKAHLFTQDTMTVELQTFKKKIFADLNL